MSRRFRCLFAMLMFNVLALPAQYLIEGQLDSNFNNMVAHLDQLKEWNEFGSVSDQMTIKSAKADSVGRFRFEGDELSDRDGIYRIRYASVGKSVIISWNPSNYVNFIFSNNDTIKIHNTNYNSNNLGNRKLALHAKRYHSYRVEYYSTGNELHQKLLTTKFQDYCKENILNTNHGLVNMFCLASSNIDLLSDLPVYRKVHRELSTPEIMPSYRSTLGKLLNTHDFDSIKNRSEWLLILFLASVCLNAFLVWKLRRYRKSKSSSPSLEVLTSKEKEVLNLIVSNKSNKDISTALFVSDATVKTHINNIYRKLNVNSRKQAIDLYKSQNSTPV